MINTMRTPPQYAAPILRAFKQAPWRTQTQAVATLSVILLVVMVLGGLYLQVAARAATAGRDLQALEAEKVELIQANDELRAELAQLRSVTRLADRARQLGYLPAAAEQIEYLRVETFPYEAALSQPPRAAPPPAPPPTTLTRLGDWLAQNLQGLLALTRQALQSQGG